MKAEIKERWIAALLSGEYEQGRNALYRHWWPASDVRCPSESYCVVGVLFDLMFKDQGTTLAKEYEKRDTDAWRKHHSEIARWAGVSAHAFLRGGVIFEAQELNDGHTSFPALAEYIREAA